VIDDLRISMEMLTCSQLWLLSFWILGNALWRVVGTICTFCYECLMGSLREEDQREFDQDSIGLHAPGYLKTQQDKLTTKFPGADRKFVVGERCQSCESSISGYSQVQQTESSTRFAGIERGLQGKEKNRVCSGLGYGKEPVIEEMGLKKVYAVRKGFRPGLYVNWADCKKQINCFSGTEYRGFKTREEAERWLRDFN
jgi:hypothetical protein